LIVKNIGFVAEVLGHDLSSESLDPIATAFIVSVPCENVSANCRFYYAVTAKHVFNGPPNETVQTVVIVNKRGGGVKPLSLKAGWYISEDETVDVAVSPIGIDPEVDASAFELDSFFDETNNPENMGVGDEVFFPGLFTAAPGIDRIQPLVRHGNLAMLPEQQIQTNDGYADLYLIEARSIGGLSGSPVFIRETVVFPMSRTNEAKSTVMVHTLGVFKLLGLIQGHWDVDESKINQAYFVHDPKRGVNMGIAKVVPARKIKQLIMEDPALIEIRRVSEQIAREEIAGSLDS